MPPPENPAMKTRIILLLLCALAPAPLLADRLPFEPDHTNSWSAGSGQAELELRGDYLPDHGVEVLQRGVARLERFRTSVSVGDGRLWIYAPFGNFEDFTGGYLNLHSDLRLRHGDVELSLENLILIPGEFDRIPVFQVFDQAGNHLANITHSHTIIEPEREVITFHNADLQATPRLAEMLGQPALAGLPIGQVWMDIGIEIPPGADVSGEGFDYSGQGLTCSGRPWWPQDGYELDVALISIGVVAGGGFEPVTQRLKITPSATLKNVGAADVPWFEKFSPASPSLYPHEPRDQHPFLVWNVYRILDGRFEQLAASGVKHAFLTTNVNCDLNCFNSHILWPGCEDTYAVSNNDSSWHQGPPEEIQASLGLWESCGSFFDPGCGGSQTGFSGSWNNRLLVEPAELDYGPAGAQYFLDSWYVIQYDIDIWNTMGYHRITPNQGGSGGYTFNPLGPFTQGPPLNEWVPENNTDPMADHQVIEVESTSPELPYPNNMPQGHVRVLVKVEERPEGDYLYRYAVMNFDLDRGISGFRIPAAGVDLSEIWMGGPPDVLDAPWGNSMVNGKLEFAAPEGAILPWFTLYNFEFVANTAPVESTLNLDLAGRSANRTTIAFQTLGPDNVGSFTLQAQPESLAVCGDDGAEFTISVLPEGKFVDPVTLGISSVLPVGMNADFSVNPVSPGGDSVLTLTTAGVAGGDHDVTVEGSDGGELSDQVSVMLALSEAQPDLPELVSPEANAEVVSPSTAFTWSSDGLALAYHLQVAVDGDFNSPLIDETVTGNSFAPDIPLAAWTAYQWRVSADNHCGETGFTAAGSFYTGSDGDNPVPTLHGIDPDSVIEGSDALMLAINGAQFHPDAEVMWGDVSLVTDWLDIANLTALVPAGLLELNAQVPVTVVNPAPGGGASNAIVFHVEPSVIFEDRYEQEAAAE
jgi:hypothetical protein